MNEGRSETPHWDVVPSPELEQKASSWLRGMIRFIIESTDEPDTTPDRFERTLGITTEPGVRGHYSDDRRDPTYICEVGITLPPAPRTGASLTIDRVNTASADTSPLVRVPDATWVRTELADAGFGLRPVFPNHGDRLVAIRFARGRVGGTIGLRGGRERDPSGGYANRVVMSWRDPYES
ncbi:hypothetical protein F8O01_01990 [Pseudoclavibacter chungangensis]|uniref:Uncharacterized protein n=1 Tax=Pseudoclavibacter chungangensis TaxID=587635 RepID=A0A7J5C178_9MICO|nr:hypothetical protein [Pseudoclavibacter chungangensis]KAB1662253.1 hypothetical protein F8O01_01990 [Pseudoclavibacter chungangensis]NYJ65458.1 hypothetical protein [Pseudoclavibacter chungangensis]